MSKRPTTAEEFAALPVGPAFSYREENGVKIPIAPDVVAFYSDDRDILSIVDSDGVPWTLGKYADGTWYKKRGG